MIRRKGGGGEGSEEGDDEKMHVPSEPFVTSIDRRYLDTAILALAARYQAIISFNGIGRN